MAFPHEAVPDGAVFGPHHVYVGAFVLLAVVWVVSDNYPRREPILAGGGALVALFGFALTWQYYPPVGAALCLAGLTAALVGVLWPGGMWAAYPLRARLAALAGVVIAADDVVEHAFGVWTPLDAFWRHVLFPVVSSL